MNSFILKILACFTMFIDHLRYTVPGHPIFMSYIGRLAFPIFAFQSVVGYAHTKNFKKYLIRLFIFALISQIPYSLYFYTTNLNVLFTFFLGLLSIYIYDNIKGHKIIGSILLIFILIFSQLIHVDYGFYGILIILIFYIFKDKKIVMTILFIIATLLLFISNYNYISLQVIALFICTILGIVPCLLYNGEQGTKVKYLFYIFYPAHILLLYVLRLFI